MRQLRVITAALLAGLAALLGPPAGAQEDRGDGAARVIMIAELKGVIGPATAHHVGRATEAARSRGAEVLIFEINTPGGLVTSMREIIETIMASPVPVVGYVSPSGAHAASAGTYILYATGVAAMAPGTNLGAATPVSMMPVPGLPSPTPDRPDERKPKDSETEKPDDGKESPDSLAPADPMTAKSVNDAVALIRSLAEVHGRNAEWAEQAVRQAATLSARDALAKDVIDLVATDIEELIAALDGRKAIAAGRSRTIATGNGLIERLEVDWITKVLGTLANPNVALFLLLFGFYGIIFELANPGSIAPGVVGAICLILGLYALNQLPLDYAGLALLLLGLGFMVAEALSPSFGILGFGGLIAFVTGAAMLIDTDIPEYQLSWRVIIAATVLSASVLILLIGYLWRSQGYKVQSGVQQMLGAPAQVLDWSDGSGHVWIEGERWEAEGEGAFAVGDTVYVRGIAGLTLLIAAEPPQAGAARG